MNDYEAHAFEIRQMLNNHPLIHPLASAVFGMVKQYTKVIIFLLLSFLSNSSFLLTSSFLSISDKHQEQDRPRGYLVALCECGVILSMFLYRLTDLLKPRYELRSWTFRPMVSVRT